MRPLLAAAIAVLVVPTAFAGAGAAYSDSVCRAGGVSWTSDRCAGRQWGLTAINAPQAWRKTRGARVTVAVVDTGADLRHPDLRRRLLRAPGSNLLKNTASRCPWQPRTAGARRSRAPGQDDNGHGTHVAGTIAAATGNVIGVAGVAPRARVLPVKVLDRKGAGSERDVARGICFAVRHGASVINMSLGNDPVSSVFIRGGKEGEDVNRAVAYAYARGVSVLIAAGNET